MAKSIFTVLLPYFICCFKKTIHNIHSLSQLLYVIVEDWDLFEKVVDYTYTKHLRSVPSEHPVLMSEASVRHCQIFLFVNLTNSKSHSKRFMSEALVRHLKYSPFSTMVRQYPGRFKYLLSTCIQFLHIVCNVAMHVMLRMNQLQIVWNSHWDSSCSQL